MRAFNRENMEFILKMAALMAGSREALKKDIKKPGRVVKQFVDVIFKIIRF
jgi:hypothetical protein